MVEGGILSDGMSERKPVHSGHVHVENGQIERFPLHRGPADQGQGRGTVLRAFVVHLPVAGMVLEQAAIRGVIVDQANAQSAQIVDERRGGDRSGVGLGEQADGKPHAGPRSGKD